MRSQKLSDGWSVVSRLPFTSRSACSCGLITPSDDAKELHGICVDSSVVGIVSKSLMIDAFENVKPVGSSRESHMRSITSSRLRLVSTDWESIGIDGLLVLPNLERVGEDWLVLLSTISVVACDLHETSFCICRPAKSVLEDSLGVIEAVSSKVNRLVLSIGFLF